METNEDLKNDSPNVEQKEQKQEIKISKQKLNDVKKNILYAYLISFMILLINSFLLDLDVSVEHSSKDYDEFSYWVTNEAFEEDFRGLFKFGSDRFESTLVYKIFKPDRSFGYEVNDNFLLKTFLGNIPYIIFGNFMLLTFLAIIIYFLRREFIKFRSKYIVKIE